jgi:hypothetical protein
VTWGNFFFFPPGVEKAGAGREFKTETVSTDSTDIFRATWFEGRWRFTLSGKVHARDVEIWDAFMEAVQGGLQPFLFGLNSKRFKLADEKHATGAGLIGWGNGARKQFQLVKFRSYPYGPPVELAPERVRFPWHDYPPILRPDGSPAIASEKIRVFVAGVEVPETAYSVQREGGVITFNQAPAYGAEIRVSCRYFCLVHGQDFVPLEAEKSATTYQFSEGAALYQAKGEDADLFGALDTLVGESWKAPGTS